MHSFKFKDEGSSERTINIIVNRMGDSDRFVFDTSLGSTGVDYQGYASDLSEENIVKLVNGLLAELGAEQQVVITTETVTTKKVELV